jgi:hypothetical protein
MNEDEYKVAVREALLREIIRLKSVMTENGLIGNTFVQKTLQSNIKAHIHSQGRGFVPQNNNSLFNEVVETLVREGLVVKQDDGSLLVIIK